MARILVFVFLVSLLQIAQGTEIIGRLLRDSEGVKLITKESFYVLQGRVPEIVKKGIMKLVIPENCRKIGICDDVPNYPIEVVSQLISQLKKSNLVKFNLDPEESINPEDTTALCDSEEEYTVPLAALDSRKKWHYILNERENPTQRFRVEKCSSPDSACSTVALFQNGYKASCEQRYVYRSMVALTENNEIVEEFFQVPSCCSCRLINP